MKFLRWTFLIIVVGIIGFISAVFIYLQSSRPVYHGELHNRGTKEEVKVYYDHYGIPHIYAQNESDAFFALGYAHAQDRLFQMEMLRRVAAGRLSEILGQDFVTIDAFFRTIGINRSAHESASIFFAKPSEPWQKNTLSYIKGINAFMFQAPTPPEFIIMGIPKVKFTPEDIYLISGYMSFSFAEALRTDPILDKVYRKYGSNYLNPLLSNTYFKEPVADSLVKEVAGISELMTEVFDKLPFRPWLGSNAWVIAPSRSKTGHVLLANDTHIGYQQPSVWFEAHMEYPGQSIYGNFLAGLPYPLIGHNRKVSWGLTMFENDDMNLYRERQGQLKKNTYLYKGVWENFKESREIIHIKGGRDTTIRIRESVHGPIINDVVSALDTLETEPVALWWTYTRFPVTVLQVTHQLSTANHIDDGRKAAARVNAPGLNILFGDTKGNIAHWAAAKIPIYRPGMKTNLILDGSTGEDDILGYYEFEDNPNTENPATGILVSANNPPDTTFAGYFPGYYAPRYRYDRLNKLLNTNEKWSVEELKKISTDVVSDVHPLIAMLIIRVIGNDEVLKMSSSHIQAAKLLNNWNGNHTSTDTTPTIYYKLLSNILEMAMKDELGSVDYNTFVNTHLVKNAYEKFLSDSAPGWWDNLNTEKKESRKDIFTEAFRKTIEDLKKSSGEITNWGWGGVHTIEHIHPIGRQKPFDKIFNVGPASISGGIETINNAGFALTTEGKYPVTYGPAMRLIMDVTDVDNSWSVLPTGQSGHVRSPYYADQFRLHVRGSFRPMMMNRDQIEEKCTNILTFKATQ